MSFELSGVCWILKNELRLGLPEEDLALTYRLKKSSDLRDADALITERLGADALRRIKKLAEATP